MEAVEILSHVIGLSNSNLDMEERLLAILRYLSESFRIDATSLFIYHAESETLNFHSSDKPADKISSKNSFSLGEGIVGGCAKKREPIILMDCSGLEGEASNQIHHMAAWRSILAQPVVDEDYLYGVLLLQNRRPLVFADEEIRLISVVAREMAGCIRHARLYVDAKKRLGELSALFEINRAVNSTGDLDQLIDLIVKTSVQIIGARGGLLRLVGEGNQVLTKRSSYGWYPNARGRLCLKEGDNHICQAIRTGKPMLVTNTKDEFVCSDPIREQTHSYICIPLRSKERLLGILSVFDKKVIGIGFEGSFVEGDLELLTAMAGYISSALEKAMAFKEVETLVNEKDIIVRELSILHETGMALIGARRLEKVLKILLSAITLGNGLGFNRAMLFLINENGRTLDGRVAVGPENHEDAARIWEALSKDKRSLNERLISEDLDRSGPSKIDEKVRKIRIPIDDESNILNKCIREKDVLNIKRGGPRYGTDLFQEIEVAEAFAVVPIISKGNVLGALLVDNIFNSREISEKDIRFLQTFVSQAGIAIENSALYQNLQDAHDELRRMQEKLVHSERLAALGEFSASIAHELRNPLVSIGGYARRLEKEVHNRYAEIIIKEVGRLEDLLNRVLTFSKVDKEQFEEADLNRILKECLVGLLDVAKAQRIEIVERLTHDRAPIICDPDQIKQAFFNILTNAVQVMKNGGTLTVTTSLSHEAEKSIAIAEVADTGKGIPPEILHNIFNPFFSTKEFETGLGLSITHRIVSNHDGSIEVKNLPASGCSFVVKLPLKT